MYLKFRARCDAPLRRNKVDREYQCSSHVTWEALDDFGKWINKQAVYECVWSRVENYEGGSEMSARCESWTIDFLEESKEPFQGITMLSLGA